MRGNLCGAVAKGETMILFVRKESEPNTPYFTLEYKDNRVIQCRGFKNCGMPPEVNAFVKVFEKKMQDAVKKQDGTKRRKAG